jgi:hypothetical protein
MPHNMFDSKKVKDIILYKMGRFLLSNKTFNIVYKLNSATCFKAYSLVFAAKELLIDYNKRVQGFSVGFLYKNQASTYSVAPQNPINTMADFVNFINKLSNAALEELVLAYVSRYLISLVVFRIFHRDLLY